MVLAVAAGSLPVTAAQAQYGSPPPLYPYVIQNSNGVQSAQPYAVQVAPNTYVIQRPEGDYPYVRGHGNGRRATVKPVRPAPDKFDRQPQPVDHALVEELRKRHGARRANGGAASTGRGVMNTTKIVRERPVVVETQRVVDVPPRVITRRHYVEDQPDGSRNVQIVTEDSANPPAREPSRPSRGEARPSDDNKKRVIAADAEITILGPDRMSIRLFRKGQGPRAQAKAE
jgi:hypothetical protein